MCVFPTPDGPTINARRPNRSAHQAASEAGANASIDDAVRHVQPLADLLVRISPWDELGDPALGFVEAVQAERGPGYISVQSQTHSWLPTRRVITTLMDAIVNPRTGERIHDFLSPRPERRPGPTTLLPRTRARATRGRGERVASATSHRASGRPCAGGIRRCPSRGAQYVLAPRILPCRTR